MHIHNPSFNRQTLIANADTHLYYRSNDHLRFSERINLLCKTIFQNFLNLFFNYINRDQLQSQWREIFWGRKEIATTRPESSVSLSSSTQTSVFVLPSSEKARTQETIDNSKDENKPLVNSLAGIEEIEASTIQPSNPLPFPQEEFKLSFLDKTSLNISSSQLSLLMEKSLYFKSLWSGNFKETLRDPLTLTQKEFIHLLNCLLDANYKVPLKKICSFIQLADYYQLTEVVKNLEQRLLDAYKSKKFELFNSSEDSLVKLKELLNFAQQYQLNTLKNYLELTVVSSLLNQASHLTEFEKIINYFANAIEGLNFSEYAYLTDIHLLALKSWELTDARLAHLAPLVNLRHLNLSGDMSNLTDAGLAHLTPLVNLQHLNLHWCDKLTDDGLAHLRSLVNLQHLNLHCCNKLTDAGLAHLRPLVNLQHLNLSKCPKLTDAGLAHLTPLVNLQHLDLSWCPLNFTGAGLAYLAPLIDLQYLNLCCCNELTDIGLMHLTPLVNLQHLDLSGCDNLTDAGLMHLTSLVNLQHLNLRCCDNLTKTGLMHLTSLVNLRQLVLSWYSPDLNEAGLAHLIPHFEASQPWDDLYHYRHLLQAKLAYTSFLRRGQWGLPTLIRKHSMPLN
ncbi:hypothetical protein [Candidatus Protochlamydia amoebophila]|uniref:F-box/LRR-repeat protein 15-like leucin rich repeat domain-containing protein n=1 Tax=Protochlamydia amoebophila (strain UWE25) TaxID=264201 RepID=Q6MEE1_PARUW|nr:hypothetical protein [Candidatus Protochlamydia amoebophila]CAF23058.1 unnamed protein product [Candidatus Protochlamydia amoebophila UWE25]